VFRIRGIGIGLRVGKLEKLKHLKLNYSEVSKNVPKVTELESEYIKIHRQKIGVWCAVSRRRIVGPIFFETTVNSPVYQDIITQFTALLEVDEHESTPAVPSSGMRSNYINCNTIYNNF
jgi:hypothetical protein